MVTANNFDKSSTGTDIEVTAFRDCGRGQRDFKDNFVMLQHDGYSTRAIGYYIDNGNLPGPDEITFKVKGSPKNVKKYLIKEGYAESDLTPTHGQDNRAELLGILDNPTLLTYQDLNEYALKDSGLEIVPSKKLEKIETRGYSQGDYAEIWYCPADCKKVWGNEPKPDELETTIHHYYWDQPIYAVITINGTEYNYWDQPEYDEYEWEPEKFAAYVAKESGVPVESIQALLPKDVY